MKTNNLAADVITRNVFAKIVKDENVARAIRSFEPSDKDFGHSELVSKIIAATVDHECHGDDADCQVSHMFTLVGRCLLNIDERDGKVHVFDDEGEILLTKSPYANVGTNGVLVMVINDLYSLVWEAAGGTCDHIHHMGVNCKMPAGHLDKLVAFGKRIIDGVVAE